MAFRAEAGRILVEDTNGDIVFDTNERHLVFTDYASGQIITPVRQASSVGGNRTDVNVDVNTVLESSINASANVVFGAFKVNVPGITPLANGGWFQATGSYLNARFTINNSGGSGTPYNAVSGHVVYTFRASGGSLIFNERTFIRCTLSLGGTTITATMPASTVDYKLFCGTFV